MRTEDTPTPTSPDEGRGPRWGQERRQQFIDFRLQWEGRINRADLMDFFGISVPQASADLKRYQEAFPGNTRYSSSEKVYVAEEGFSAGFPTSGQREYLAQLLAVQQGVLPPHSAFFKRIPSVGSVPVPTRTVEEATLKKLVRAISGGMALDIEYQSVTRQERTTRQVSPHAFGHDGMRWHVRAYCHLNSEFRDFVIGRILQAGGLCASNVRGLRDEEWERELNLVLVPHPELTAAQKRGIEFDYAMRNGKVVMPCRQAMLYYTLYKLGLEKNGHPREGHRQVVIANLEEIRPFLPKPQADDAKGAAPSRRST